MAKTFALILGEEIRRERIERGWSRKSLHAQHLAGLMSLQAMATYELGTRQLATEKLYVICHAMGANAAVVLERAITRFQSIHASDAYGLRVNLRAVVADEQPALETLRRWARVEIDGHPDDAPSLTYLTPAAIDRLAELCHIDHTTLIASLVRLPR